MNQLPASDFCCSDVSPSKSHGAWLLPFLLLPWLNPYTAGPSSNVWPLLLSALCAVVLFYCRPYLTARVVTLGWLAAAAASAGIGVLQYFGLAPALGAWVSQTQAGEAFANLRQRNQFATLSSIGFVALLGWVATAQQQARSLQADWRIPRLAWLLAGLLAVGNAVSNSRTGALQWLLVALLTAWWALPGRRQLLLFALQSLLAYAVALFVLPWLLQWATGLDSSGLLGRLSDGPACSSRRVLWANVLTLIGQHPWVGWGWGELSYAHFITLYPGPRFCEILDNAHNLPLHLAVELGIPAALALCGGAAWLVWRARPWREQVPERQMAWGVLAVIGLHSLVEYPLWYGPFQLAAALAIGLLWSTAGAGQWAAGGNAGKFQSKRQFPHYLRAVVAIVAIATLAAVAASYYRVSQLFLAPADRSTAYRLDTLNQVRATWLFRQQVRFAELGFATPTPANAADMHRLAEQLLHFSPEPRVVEKLIESATLLGQDDEALRILARYRTAFPEDHARWASRNASLSPAGSAVMASEARQSIPTSAIDAHASRKDGSPRPSASR